MSTSTSDSTLQSVIPLPSEVVEALVQTGATETRYRRAGCGSSVVFLVRLNGPGSQGASLFRSLAARFRVIAPEPHSDLAVEQRADGGGVATLSFSTWLRGVIDGLGLVRPALVADEHFGVAALGFALTDPDRVDRLIVVSHDAADPATPETTVGDVLSQTGHPLLLLRVDASEQPSALGKALAAEVIHFLTGGESNDGSGVAQLR